MRNLQVRVGSVVLVYEDYRVLDVFLPSVDRIMILSVLKNTQSKVKFWFLKNYLSPTFKDFIPHMAEEYGFQYELVQYKWPRWLHQQSEKQRIMWG